MFADRAKIIIASGKGGDGHVSFRREKYVAAGGPDGGDGGKGGDVIFVVDKGLNNLSDYRHRRKFAAGDGEEGGKRRCHGKDGADLILKVPAGTVIKDAATDKVICDMSGENKRKVILTGGKGGRGNMHFATSTMQVPKYAENGGDAIELEIKLELKLLADVGLVGFPNVGKSTLLSRLSNAKPEIGNYPFTTLNPILGYVETGDGNGFVMADLPGLIEGAADGVGLGHEFLRHIERTKVLVHLIDLLPLEEDRNHLHDVKAINHELMSYSADLMKKPQILVLNKIDAAPEKAEEEKAALEKEFACEGYKVMLISAVTGQGIEELKKEIIKTLEEHKGETEFFESEYDPNTDRIEALPYTVSIDKEGAYCVTGPKIDKMLGYTNLESEKGFLFFQNFLKDQGIIKEMKEMGLQEGDTVKVNDLEFEYFE